MFRRNKQSTHTDRDRAPVEVRRRTRKNLLENFCAEPEVPADWLRSTAQLTGQPCRR